MLQKVLIANRGEIAVRVIRTCHQMGIATAAVYSEVDRTSLHVRMADEAYLIGPAPASESYLQIERIIHAARLAGADAIHPGYGFLSENADFAESCRKAGICFIGPSPDAIRTMGIKTRARELMLAANIPVVPGTSTVIEDASQAASLAAKFGYPVIFKAAAGGGGKGMRMVHGPADLPRALEQAQSEATQAFGNGAVYLEKAIIKPRHVEVQILADEHGNIVHLGERECSLQRRHQKILEETPSPLVSANPAIQEALYAAAVAAAKAVDYSNAGTVEFLMDAEYNFYFLEMNTRLQVEHPVTEWVTGIDLVMQQILIANGQKLRMKQENIHCRGHAMECRIYAEDPNANFMPSPGRITSLDLPHGPGIRVDSGAANDWVVPLEYDPLIAKLSAWAPDRMAVIRKLQQAVHESAIGGIATTLGFFQQLLEDSRFQAGDIHTNFLGEALESAAVEAAAPSMAAELAAILAVIHAESRTKGQQSSRQANRPSLWKSMGRQSLTRNSGEDW